MLVEINGEKVDVGKALIEDGFAMADKRREQRLQKLVSETTMKRVSTDCISPVWLMFQTLLMSEQ